MKRKSLPGIKATLIGVLMLASLSAFCNVTYYWQQMANFEGVARHRASAFSIGNKGYIGLGHINSVTNILFEDFWEYDPASNTWTQKANFGGGLRYHAISFTVGNKAYVGTGRDAGNVYSNDIWEYDPTTNIWTQKTPCPGVTRRGGVGFTIGDKGYYSCGQTTGGSTNDLWEYTPATDSWASKAPIPTGGRISAVGFAIGNKGYIGTGSVSGLGSSTDFWEYDPTSNAWTQKAAVGTINRQEATGFALNGHGFIGTGDNFSSGTNYGDFYEFDPATNVWTQIDDFAGLKRRYMVSFTIGDKAYSGTGTNGTNFADFWVYQQTLGTEGETANALGVNVYPNPISDYANVTIQAPNAGDLDGLQFKLYDLQGKLVRTLTPENPNFFQIYKEDLSAGTYVFRIETASNQVQSGQVIIR